MATKFPIEMVTSHSSAKPYSPLIWNGSDLLVSADDRFNLLTLSNNLSTAVADFTSFQATYTPILSLIPELRTHYNEISPKVELLVNQFDTLEEELVKFNGELQAYAGRLGPLEIKLGDLVTSVTTLLTSISEVKGSQLGLEARVKYIEDEGSLAARVGILESLANELRNRIEPVETDLATSVSSINTMTIQLSNLETRVNSAESSIGALQSQLS